MSNLEPKHAYVYQPYGIQDIAHFDADRMFGVGGIHILATVKGLTRDEAEAIVLALRELDEEPRA